MNPNDFGDALTLLLAPQTDQFTNETLINFCSVMSL